MEKQKENNQNAKTEPTQGKPKVMVVVANCEQLNVRSAASKKSRALTIVDVGTELKVEDTNQNGWTKVSLEDGTIGFVMTEFIEIK